MKRRVSFAFSFVCATALVAYIAISCSKNDKNDSTPQIQLNTKSLSFITEAYGTSTFKITSNTSWTVSSSQPWLAVNPASGANNGTVTVTVLENTDIEARTAVVTVSATGATPQTVTVTQGGAKSNISVSRKAFSVAPASNSADTFKITSNLSWTVSSSQTWLTLSSTSGSNNGVITVTAQENTGGSRRVATITVSATGATSQIITVAQAGGGACIIPAMPSYSSLVANAYLPDPFMFMDGTRMIMKAEWACRRAEIAAQAQEYEYGYKPITSNSTTTGAKSGNAIVVTVTDNGQTISFTCSITYPSTGTAPYPAMIGIGGSSLSNTELSNLGVAVINFPCDQVAQQVDGSSRGKGKFYDMYGSTHSAGALMAWAWGVSRLIDAIEKTTDVNIDPTRLGTTGCSRNGKGALCVGAFDERIKLTIPQESGSGGAASWRVSDWQGTTVQTLGEITGENVWFRTNFNQFNSTATKLPFDHHMIEALCAPRALLVIENTSMVWLGNVSTWTTGNAAHYVWEALGIPDMMGYSQYGHSDHCGFQSVQQPEVTAYVQKFLIGGGTGNTTIMKTDGGLTFDKAKWVNWTVPSLQ